ncbi:MAG: flagellar biosynthesis anti-sigma factor FlgM [Rhodocyclaceae bacterium]
MKIEGSTKMVSGLLSGENRAKPQPDAKQAEGQAGAKVEISSLSASLGRAEAAMAATPTVDRARVEELKLAIAEGRFKVDASKVADGLIDSVKEMLGSEA